ncbi:MAG: hypothetical protein COU29_02300 [Candidatus Magasanikbacteria bacterium CG10_big_fil_rev_8_21_14_0_10_36_32]|uniref:Uncharacterized protein n=1 Tax=Candidatus Magasanikbacteria bacterium CG10_big_fil_rev_8_21_14_0_10_36_32 TaxID=1974646 RepID=A0A2M6W719_9BACT|nr:MAG: hypothetical protein COU29_02300 [Candidatus Magasanikbacteria bacterium CG10_big_fil_rev_8_21_14_0_10_36_32]
MMILNLNLLSESRKKEICLFARLGVLKTLLIYAALILILLLLFLPLINLLLSEQLNNLVGNSSLIGSGHGTYNHRVLEINTKIKNINLAGGQFSLLTPRLLEIINTTPPDIQLKYITLNLTSTELALPGTALTREALLNYEQILKKTTWVENIDLPKSQLLQKKDVPFQIKLKITLPKIEENCQ